MSEIVMDELFKGVEPMVYASRINVPYHWWAGDTASKFFIALRDEKKILGARCDYCSMTFVPPRKTCPRCGAAEMKWADVAACGTVLAYTVVRRQMAAMPKKTPVVYALIKLDGAETGMLHMIDGVHSEYVKIGMRVRAQFAPERKGHIFDIEYFRPEG